MNTEDVVNLILTQFFDLFIKESLPILPIPLTKMPLGLVNPILIIHPINFNHVKSIMAQYNWIRLISKNYKIYYEKQDFWKYIVNEYLQLALYGPNVTYFEMIINKAKSETTSAFKKEEKKNCTSQSIRINNLHGSPF